MQFLQSIASEDNTSPLYTSLVSRLHKGERVLWFLSGGSSIKDAVVTINKIDAETTKNLTIMLIDERFGAVGHKDSNYQQLLDAGFNPKQATFIPVLEADLSLEATTIQFNQNLNNAFGAADAVIGLLGIGPDGHISGILPNSPAALNTTDLATSYESEPYTRITTTFQSLKKIDIDYSYVYGAAKHNALLALRDTDVSLQEQPSQILKQLPEAYVFNDQIERTF